MSYSPDYIHLHNLIVRAIEGISEQAEEVGNDETTKRYGELIDFLETMYINSVVAFVGVMLSGAKQAGNAEDTSSLLSGAREIMELAPESVEKKIFATYHTMIEGLNLPDAYQEKTHNETVADAIKRELNQPKPPDSQ